MAHPLTVERLSALSASEPPTPPTSNQVQAPHASSELDEKMFKALASPVSPSHLEGGALRPGGAPNLYSRENIGLLAQYAAIGIIYGSLWGVIYPFLNNYLRMSGTETASASALLALPWTWKMFIGAMSDCFPIFGLRRRPYIVIGWVVTCAACIAMAALPIGDPYYPDPSLAYVSVNELTAEQLASFNTDAPSNGVKFVALLVIANLGCVIALTASDGILVDMAQREPEAIRGTVQTMICISQELFQTVSALLIGLGLNNADYGGSFSSAIGFNVLMIICAVASVAIIPISWFCITEPTSVKRTQSLREYWREIYALLQQRVVYQIIAFRFFRNVFSNFSVTAAYPVQSVWAKVEPLNSSMATIVGYLVAAGAYYVTKRYGLGWNWRWMIVITQIGVIVIDSIPTFLTIWDVVRNQWLWLGGPLLENVPFNIGYVISTYAAMEIIDARAGNEAAVYGLISTVSTLATPFSTVLYKNVDANFDVTSADLTIDDTHVRQQVSYVYLIAYAFKLFSLVFVFLLPPQKAETQELKRTGGSSKILANITIVYLVFSFCWSLMTNVMTFSSVTSCMKIAGGSGC